MSGEFGGCSSTSQFHLLNKFLTVAATPSCSYRSKCILAVSIRCHFPISVSVWGTQWAQTFRMFSFFLLKWYGQSTLQYQVPWKSPHMSNVCLLPIKSLQPEYGDHLLQQRVYQTCTVLTFLSSLTEGFHPSCNSSIRQDFSPASFSQCSKALTCIFFLLQLFRDFQYYRFIQQRLLNYVGYYKITTCHH